METSAPISLSQTLKSHVPLRKTFTTYGSNSDPKCARHIQRHCMHWTIVSRLALRRSIFSCARLSPASAP